MNIGRRCGVTGKVIFKSHKAALIRAGEILTNDESNRRYTPKEFRTYQCEYCGFWHITGKMMNFVPQSERSQSR